jgi:hypothetical protein
LLTPFRWPKGRKDVKWLDSATRSRQLLKDFWASTRSLLDLQLQKCGRTAEEKEHNLALTRFAESPEHVGELHHERCRQPRLGEKTATSNDRFEPTFTAPEEKKVKCRKLAQEVDSTRKEKTRAPIDVVQDNFEDVKITDVCQPRFEVNNNNSLCLFGTMFGSESNFASTFKWQELVAAMVDTGCSAYSNGGGSAASFKHPRGTIVFHRPHPDPTVHSILLRSMGKRLTKRFGGHTGSFVGKATKR